MVSEKDIIITVIEKVKEIFKTDCGQPIEVCVDMPVARNEYFVEMNEDSDKSTEEIFIDNELNNDKSELVQLFERESSLSFCVADSGLSMCAGVELGSGITSQKCLIYINNSEDNTTIPVKVIPVVPSGENLLTVLGEGIFDKKTVLEIEKDPDNPGEYYISTVRMKRILQKCHKKGIWTKGDVKKYIQEVYDWIDKFTELRKRIYYNKVLESNRRKQKQFWYSNKTCKRCKRIVISHRAYTAIMAEALSRDPVETGAPLFGICDEDTWYVVESADPGIRTIHTTVHHEMDEEYINHLYKIVSRLYKHELTLLGLWHRHPGDYNRFSQDDNRTNDAYAEAIGKGTLSILLNFVPGPKLTCYYLDRNGTGEYFTPEVYIGDEYFDGTDYLELADEKTLMNRKVQMQEELMGAC